MCGLGLGLVSFVCEMEFFFPASVFRRACVVGALPADGCASPARTQHHAAAAVAARATPPGRRGTGGSGVVCGGAARRAAPWVQTGCGYRTVFVTTVHLHGNPHFTRSVTPARHTPAATVPLNLPRKASSARALVSLPAGYATVAKNGRRTSGFCASCSCLWRKACPSANRGDTSFSTSCEPIPQHRIAVWAHVSSPSAILCTQRDARRAYLVATAYVGQRARGDAAAV